MKSKHKSIGHSQCVSFFTFGAELADSLLSASSLREEKKTRGKEPEEDIENKRGGGGYEEGERQYVGYNREGREEKDRQQQKQASAVSQQVSAQIPGAIHAPDSICMQNVSVRCKSVKQNNQTG